MSVYGVVLGGWASNNKYSIYGAVRATAQMLSYEIPMGVAILTVVLACGELRLERIVEAQTGAGTGWLVFHHPVAAFILLVTLFAETNRAPFDLAESEQELVGGFHTEYSAMKFALFFLAEYAHMITGSAVFAVLFLGGWDLLPFVSVPGFRPQDHGVLAMLLKMGVMAVKVAFFIFLFMWVRWTLPRFRFDQLMRLAWKGLIPISLGVFAVAIIGLHFGWHDSLVFNLAGNALVVAVAIPIAAASKVPISGRQANMPPTFARTDAVT
jgi:NADH-quinone oxidoreductase subunit H